jgi:CheY-like chemotaxis protein
MQNVMLRVQVPQTERRRRRVPGPRRIARIRWSCASLPSREDLQRDPAALPGRLAGGAVRVLVADDEASVRMICTFNLEAAGLGVRQAVDGADALTAIRAERPDLVLLDVMMPNRDGWAVASELRADPATRDLPIVFLTARVDQADRQRAHELGAVGYITKPFDPIGLAARLNRILDRIRRGEREQLQDDVLRGRDS